MQKLELNKKNIVFVISLLLTIALSLWAVLFSTGFAHAAELIYTLITDNFGWLYLLAMLIFVVFAVAVAFSKWGNIKLGADDSVPDYSTKSWFAMLFGAGMGVGLVYWGAAEPASHLTAPISGIEPGSAEAIGFAFRSSFMHWGFHPWANYCIIGLCLAYFTFRKNRPSLISSIFEPLIGRKGTEGLAGRTIDILAVFATVAGVVTSLGLGVLQINAGLNYIFGVPVNTLVKIIIVVVISLIFTVSSVGGIGSVIQKIGDANLYIAIALMAAVFLLGPRVEMLENLTNGIGQYLQNFFGDSLMMLPGSDDPWVGNWRILYWAWWIAWAPFVGSFIARISRGRTIREFILGVVFAPALGSILWFAIMGTLPVHLVETGMLSLQELTQLTAAPENVMFAVMGSYPLGKLLCGVALVLLCTFFVTSASSSTFVLAMCTSTGDMNPPNKKKVLWGVMMSLLAIGVLISGGRKSVQTISLAAAFPFIFIMLFAMASFMKALKGEKTGKISG